MSSASSASTHRSAAKIMVAILGSRLLGLVREVVLNNIFGAGKELDAFLTAFRFPNLLRDLFAEGALSTAFVTTFSKKLTTEGKASAFKLANLVFTSMYILLGVITLLGIFLSPWLVDSIAFGFQEIPGKTELTIDLTRIMFPFILLVSLAAVYMGLLNSLGSFGLPASASTAFNAVSILSGLAIGYLFDPHFGPRAIYGFAIGTVLGGGAQLVIQIPRSLQFGFRPAWILDWKDPGLRQVYRLMLPAVMGGAAVQINVLINTSFASTLGDGAVTWLNNAFRLMQLPIGMFGVAIATVVLPAVSKSAAHANLDEFRAKVVEGLRLALFLTLPASIALAFLAKPLIEFIYQRGAFTAFDTEQSALALQAYTVGLACYAIIKVIVPTFYALDAPKIPVRISFMGIGLNLSLNWIFIYVFHLGIMGLALSTSLVAILNTVQLLFHLRNRLGGIQGRQLLGFSAKLVIACAIMGVDLFLLAWLLPEPIHAALMSFHTYLFPLKHFIFALLNQTIFLALAIAISGSVFLISAALLRMHEMEMITSLIARKWKRR